jgi:hypothetical protein
MSYVNLLRGIARRSGSRCPVESPRRYRPCLEVLEARQLLSTFTVDHLADNLVGTGLNGSLRYCHPCRRWGRHHLRRHRRHQSERGGIALPDPQHQHPGAGR